MSTSPDTSDHTKGDHSSFLKNLADRRNVASRSDGSQPKKRGPKPDSKPALTRRQELNRQAQRTHRERKELYIKALEDEVLRLKEIYSNVSNDKSQLAEENRLLKDMLSQHGVTISGASLSDELSNPDNTYRHGSNPASDALPSYESGASSSPFSPGLTTTSQSSGPSLSLSSQVMRQTPVVGGDQLRQLTQQALEKKGIDYEQAGIDFVLTLERPCMDHLPWLMQLASEQSERPCGHVLMASCPPEPFSSLPSDGLFSCVHAHDKQHASVAQNQGQQTWALSKGDLATLLDLSASLGLDGELTPVTAWSLLMSHPRILELAPNDIQVIAETLQGKIRCYGFGAVTEEFEVRDAIENVLATKSMQTVLLAM